MHSIERWAWWLSVGNFLSASAIAFFAISTIYDKINLSKHEASLKYLHILHSLLLPQEIDDGSSKTLKPRDPTKGIDNTLIWNLFGNLSLNTWNALNISKMPITSNELPDSEVDTIKRTIYQNRSAIPGLIRHIGIDFVRLRKLYKFISVLFVIGLLIQIIAILKMI